MVGCFGLARPPLLGQTPRTGEVELQIIVVNSLADAQQVLDRLKKGDDFAALAKSISTDSTATDGGSMGSMDPALLRTELRDALKGRGPGEVSAPVKIPSGYAILRIVPPNDTRGKSTEPTRIQPLTGRGNVRYSSNVAGAPEVDVALLAFPKPDGWDRNLHAICSARQESLTGGIERMHEFLSGSDGKPSLSPMDAMQTRYALGQFEAYRGNLKAAIEAWEAAYPTAVAEMPEAVPQLDEALGTAYLHQSEMENDIYRNPGDRCIIPPAGKASYAKAGDSEKAVQHFLRYLDKKPEDLEVRWLLNLAYMTLGKYPDGVPTRQLIQPELFGTQEKIGRFVDVAPAAGLNLFSMAGGIIVDDFDNDGLLDIVTSSYDVCEHLHFFHNNGDGTFTDRSREAGLMDQLGGLNLIQADYDNDGCMDILVMRGGWQWPMPRSLLHNNCDGTFTDVTEKSGLAEPMAASQTAVWADINNDGFVDLFVGNEKGPLQLFRNKGDGTFQDISHAAGIDLSGFAKGVVAADYDNDGYVDLYVSTLNGKNFLFHNNHDGTFREVAEQAGVQEPWAGFPAWFFDYDNDGWPDLFVTSYYMSSDEVMRSYLGMPNNAETLKLYRNQGNGTFKDVTKEVGLNRVFMPMGANFGDVDNDGFLDIYLGNGNPSYTSLIPHVLLRNKEGKSFVDVTASSGTGELHKGHGVAFADIDRDGDEDILTVIGGAVPGDAHAFRLFENPGNGNDWINLKLVGKKTNRAALGARIKVTVENEGKGRRSIFRTVGSGGSFGASPLEQHIGLGPSAKIVELEVWWPTSDTRQKFRNVKKDQFLEITEFVQEYKKLVRAPYRLGGTARKAEGQGTRSTDGTSLQ
jgi:tetratricopeptide (TPR) repeat protein